MTVVICLLFKLVYFILSFLWIGFRPPGNVILTIVPTIFQSINNCYSLWHAMLREMFQKYLVWVYSSAPIELWFNLNIWTYTYSVYYIQQTSKHLCRSPFEYYKYCTKYDYMNIIYLVIKEWLWIRRVERFVHFTDAVSTFDPFPVFRLIGFFTFTHMAH